MILDRAAVEAVNYRPTKQANSGAQQIPLHQLAGDLRSYETTIQLAMETLTERQLAGVQAERHLARIYEAIAQSNRILADIKAVYGDL